jgi:hypothetical protein
LNLENSKILRSIFSRLIHDNSLRILILILVKFLKIDIFLQLQNIMNGDHGCGKFFLIEVFLADEGDQDSFHLVLEIVLDALRFLQGEQMVRFHLDLLFGFVGQAEKVRLDCLLG